MACKFLFILPHYQQLKPIKTMKSKFFLISIIVGAVFAITSCKKDYAKLSTEFIRNLPDSCEFLVQVENDVEHLVYYKEPKNTVFFCCNLENDNVEEIEIPKVHEAYGVPVGIGGGRENIVIGYTTIKYNEISGTSMYDQACIQIYNLKTRSFKEFLTCNGCVIDPGKKELSCVTYDVNKYGEGTRLTEIFDFDGNPISKKEEEVSGYEE